MMPCSVSGSRELVGRPLLDVELDELLRVQRVSAGALEQRLLRLGGQEGALEEAPDELGGLLVGERRERQRRRVQLAAAPVRASFEELRPGGRNDQERDVGQPVHEFVEEVEEALVGPVDVLDHDDERALFRETLEEAPPGRKRLVPAVAAELRLAAEAEQREEVFLDPALSSPDAGERVLDRLVDLRCDLLRCVLLERACLRLDDLA